MSNGMGNDRFKPTHNADDDTDMFGDFEFKPLTEGLGFHKKAEKLKSEIKSSNIGFDAGASRSSGAGAVSATPEPPPRASSFGSLFGSPSSSSTAKSSPSEIDFTPARDTSSSARPASQSISDLIASLPPSLDFVDTPSKERTPEPKQGGFSRPQIFQPIAREEFKTPSMGASSGISSGPTIGSVLPTPGSRAGGVSMSAAMAAPLIGGGGGTGVLPAPGTIAGSAPAVPSQYRDKMNESYAKAFPQVGGKREATVAAPVQTERTTAAGKSVAQNMPGAILDAMVVLGISTIFLVCILAITHVNLMGLLTNANTDLATQFHLGLLFVAVLQMYMLTARSFFGASLGEWAFDLQVGTLAQQRASLYPLQIAWRTMLITLTGFFVIPVLSMIFKRDLAKPLTGVELIHRP